MKSISLRPLPVILAVALGLRVALALAVPNIMAADEVFQFLEQAHRLVYGGGLVPWEFQIGLRSWLIPLLLTPPMVLGRALSPDPAFGLALIRVLLCVASLSIVYCAVRWGERLYGARGGWVAGGLAALWPDLWLMAPHVLEESLAAYVLVPAVYLIDWPRRDENARRIVLAGLLLGVAFVLRLQLAPAIAVAGLFLCGGNLRRWRLALPAAALPVLAAGLLDWLTWGQPFRSFWLNLYVNIFLHVAKDVFGNDATSFLPAALIFDWLWTLPFLLLLLWRGGQRLPVPTITGAVILLTHLSIAHKEFRFIFPALALLLPVAGVGLAELMARPDAHRRAPLYALWLAGPFLSPLAALLLEYQTNAYALFHTLARERPCLVSLQNWDKSFVPLPILFTGRTRFTNRAWQAGGLEADAIIGSLGSITPPSGFTLQTCVPGSWIPFRTPPHPRTCLWTRPIPATCAAGPVVPFEIVFPEAARRFIVRKKQAVLF